MPGPRRPLYALGRELVEIIPYVPIASRLRVGVAIFSYRRRLAFGVTGDYDSTADLRTLVQGIKAGLAELVAAAGAATPVPAADDGGRSPRGAARTRRASP